ncbi:hypothetical protein [Capillimicrobium parvum]|uniref:Uncharacterized protein n=1 Tax=Capillimicrobium parvum TaxID=2884022 RepID=A0A9E6XXQ0_9ACTN|nr:hypothetical protein [Capillimicrobium parvum]UGS36379.1 hypothetical protein DSM104329_02783 [Capillimicrobium parvum]
MDPDGDSGDRRTPAERLLARRLPDRGAAPHQFDRRSLQAERTLEGYLRGSAPPRWMERAAQVDRGIEREREELERAHRALRERCGDDPAAFPARWRELVERWPFDAELNELIAQHNEWYPIERRLPMNPRTGDYVLIMGRSHRRPVLDAAWALREFPAEVRRPGT